MREKKEEDEGKKEQKIFSRKRRKW